MTEDDIWIGANGQKMLIKDMTDTHLINAHRKAQQMAATARWKMAAPEETFYFFVPREQYEERHAYWCLAVEDLHAEIERRGLLVG